MVTILVFVIGGKGFSVVGDLFLGDLGEQGPELGVGGGNLQGIGGGMRRHYCSERSEREGGRKEDAGKREKKSRD